jgi:uncharacterized protein
MKTDDIYREKSIRGTINVAHLLQEPVGTTHRYSLQDIFSASNKIYIAGEAVLTHTSQGILTSVKLTTKIELTCSRCLSFFQHSVSFEFEEEFISALDIFCDAAPCTKEILPFPAIDANQELDLGEIIRQYTILNLPMKPLCEVGCQGIKEEKTDGSTQEEIR